MFAWRMTRPVNLFSPFTGLPLVGLGSFAVQTSIIVSLRGIRGASTWSWPVLGAEDFGGRQVRRSGIAA